MDSFAFCGLSGCKPVALSGGGSGKGLGLKAAVGLASRCRNYPDDVKKVQEALNRFPPLEGGPSPKLVVDGIVGPKTSGAISAFQRKQFGIGKADGVVDVGMRTDERLAGVTSTYGSLPAEMMQHIPRAVDHQYLALHHQRCTHFQAQRWRRLCWLRRSELEQGGQALPGRQIPRLEQSARLA